MTTSGHYDHKAIIVRGGGFAIKQGFGGLETMTRRHKECHSKRGGGLLGA